LHDMHWMVVGGGERMEARAPTLLFTFTPDTAVSMVFRAATAICIAPGGVLRRRRRRRRGGGWGRPVSR